MMRIRPTSGPLGQFEAWGVRGKRKVIVVKRKECYTDRDCPAGFICSFGGSCVTDPGQQFTNLGQFNVTAGHWPGPGGERPRAPRTCRNNDDCRSGYVCFDGNCQRRFIPGGPPAGGNVVTCFVQPSTWDIIRAGVTGGKLAMFRDVACHWNNVAQKQACCDSVLPGSTAV